MIDDIVTKEFFDWYFDPATGEIEVKSSKVLYRSATKDELKLNKRYKRRRTLALISFLIFVMVSVWLVYLLNFVRVHGLFRDYIIGNNQLTIDGLTLLKYSRALLIADLMLCILSIAIIVIIEQRRNVFLNERSNYGFESEDEVNLNKYYDAYEKRIKWRETHPEAAAINDFKKTYIEESAKTQRNIAMIAASIAMSIESRRN